MTQSANTTRKRLLEVATRLFCERGFDGVSTRDIASATGTTLPSIPHHFGSKNGLYEAVLEDIARQMDERLCSASRAASEVIARKSATRQHRVEALQDLLSSQTKAILQSPTDWCAAIDQEERLPSGAFTPIAQVLEKQLLRPISQLVAAIRGISPSSSEAKLQAVTLLGMVLIFRTRKTAALQILRWTDLTPSRIDVIVDLLRRDVQAIFGDHAVAQKEKISD